MVKNKNTSINLLISAHRFFLLSFLWMKICDPHFLVKDVSSLTYFPEPGDLFFSILYIGRERRFVATACTRCISMGRGCRWVWGAAPIPWQPLCFAQTQATHSLTHKMHFHWP
jgi:hypothetical protein